MTHHIIVIDDDPEIRELLRRGLELEGFQVTLTDQAERAIRILLDTDADLVLLDVMMPGMDGFEACRLLRETRPRLPIVMLTARDSISDRVAGLEMGADDYIVKPFAFVELLARIRVRLRQVERSGDRELQYADLSLNTATREARRGDRELSLTATEYGLLRLFLQNPRQVLVRDLIYERVWGYELIGESKIIEVYIGYLRNKLEASGESRLIHTVRGAGYVLREST